MSFPLFLCDIIGSGKVYLKVFNKPRSNIFEIFIVILINEQSSVHLDPEKIIDQLNNTVNVSAETNPEMIFQKQDVRLLRFRNTASLTSHMTNNHRSYFVSIYANVADIFDKINFY